MVLSSPDGVSLEARAAKLPGARGGVVVCHPHPLYGGDMDNPVVIRVVEVCAELGLATLRFNFRGVGRSTGTHGNGLGERDDLETALRHLGGALPTVAMVALVGYSFGAMVAAHVATGHPALAGLSLIAPPLGFEGVSLPPALAAFSGPLAVVAGTRRRILPQSGPGGASGAAAERSPDGRRGREPLLLRQALPPRGGGAALGARVGHRLISGTRGSRGGVAVPAERMMRIPSSTVSPVARTSSRGSTITSPR